MTDFVVIRAILSLSITVAICCCVYFCWKADQDRRKQEALAANQNLQIITVDPNGYATQTSMYPPTSNVVYVDPKVDAAGMAPLPVYTATAVPVASGVTPTTTTTRVEPAPPVSGATAMEVPKP
ncbi:hypothetical protein HDU97_003815 [Phlyctochytrium planicorne]|nr:hypothetical protein HDU97_003815 [Phlyctochytrium planicorne]